MVANFLNYFFANFYAKTWWTIQKLGNFYNLSFFNSSDLGFDSRVNIVQILVDILFLGSSDSHIFADPDQIQEAKILQFQQIRILSTAWMLGIFPKAYSQVKLPKSILATALGTLDCSSRSTRLLCSLQHFKRPDLTLGNCTSGKFPLGKLSLGKSPLGKC